MGVHEFFTEIEILDVADLDATLAGLNGRLDTVEGAVQISGTQVGIGGGPDGGSDYALKISGNQYVTGYFYCPLIYLDGDADPASATRRDYVDGQIATRAASSHTHDDRYYTESEVDTALSGKAATSHTHSIANVTSLQTALDGKEPLRSVRTVNPSGGTISINADTDGDTIKSTLTGDATLNVPTNGFEDQILQGVVLASSAQRVLTFHASLGRLTAITNTLTIPSGKVGRYALRRTDITGSAKWLVESVGVEQ